MTPLENQAGVVRFGRAFGSGPEDIQFQLTREIYSPKQEVPPLRGIISFY